MNSPSKPVPPSQQASPAGAATRPVRGALASLSLAMLLPALGTSIANVGLPDMARALHAPFQDVQWIVLFYLLAITALIVSVVRLGDMIGRRRLLLPASPCCPCLYRARWRPLLLLVPRAPCRAWARPS